MLTSKCHDPCQNVLHAIERCKCGHEPHEILFAFSRCLVVTDRRILDERLHANIPNIAEIELDAALNCFVDPLFLDQTEFQKPYKDNALFRAFERELLKRRINKTSP